MYVVKERAFTSNLWPQLPKIRGHETVRTMVDDEKIFSVNS